MLVIPAIDLLGGRCVQLVQGDYSRATVYDDDPLVRARAFAADGAKRLHVVDLDAARGGSESNLAAVEAVVQGAGTEVEVAGGVRSAGIAQSWFERGASHVVVGTLAVERPDEVIAMAARWPGRIYIAVDARQDRVATQGWERDGGVTVGDLISRYADVPLAGVIYTDIDRDGMLGGLDLEHMGRTIASCPHPLIASGGLTTIADVRGVAGLGAVGVIVGTAIYEGRISLREAIAELG